jgi:fructokinase
MILVCGEALYDLFLADSDPQGVIAIEAWPGGSPFNVAVGLARLGQAVSFFSSISTDVFGERLVRLLRREGVSDRYLRRSPAPSTLSIVGAGPQGSTHYSFRGDGAADRMILAADLPAEMTGLRAIHVGSLATVVHPIGESLRLLVTRGTSHCVVSYDPNVRPTVEPDPEVWRRAVSTLNTMSHLMKVSAEDVDYLYRGADPKTLAARWIGAGARLVVLTRGELGVSAWTRRVHVQLPAERVTVVDTVGAGDAFQAALLAGLAETGALSPEAIGELDEPALSRLLAFATRAAAITCSRRGANTPRRAELPALHGHQQV